MAPEAVEKLVVPILGLPVIVLLGLDVLECTLKDIVSNYSTPILQEDIQHSFVVGVEIIRLLRVKARRCRV